MKHIYILLILLTVFLTGCTVGQTQGDQVVNIFTDRHYQVDETLYNKFEDETGIKVNFVKASADELIQRLQTEGSSTEADLLYVADAGRLYRAKEADLLQPVESETIESIVPDNLKDNDNEWFAVTVRARVIVYSKDRVDVSDLSTYEDLATDKWKDRVLIRTSTNTYNQSLLASFIEINGEEATKDWAQGFVDNFARDPKGNDRDQAKAIVGGTGDVAIMNTYYIGLMFNSSDPEEVSVAEQVGVFFPNQETTGTHINISGVGITKHSKNKENTIKLIEFLLSESSQNLYTSMNYEYPVNQNVDPSELLLSWGTFIPQSINLSALGSNYQKSMEIANQVGWK